MKDDVTVADKPKHTANGEGPMPGFGLAMLNCNRGFESWAQSAARMTGRAAELYEEITTFWQRRFEADLDAWEAFASCRNPRDFFECQRQFAQKATNEYCDRASRLTSQIIGVINSTTSPFRQEQPLKS